ncbi:MAG: peptidase M16 [Cytophagia bacterium]|nr:peptidase M16 [Cytophagia bacterium]
MKKLVLLLLTIFFINSTLLSQVDRTKPPVSGPPPVINLGKPNMFSLKNGLKVIIVENSKLPRAYANLDIDNYPDYEGDIKGVASLVSSLMGNGTTTQSKDDYNEEIDYMGASLSLSAGGGFASSLKRYFPRVLEMMSDGLKNPVFTLEDFEKEKNILIDGIKSSQNSVPDIASIVGGKLFFGSNHPFGEFATEESVNNISLKDVKKYYETYAKPNNAYLTIVGDVNYEEIKPLVEKLFGDWKKGKLPKYTMPVVNDLENPEINFIDMSNAVQSEISVGNIINISMSDPDYFPLRLANQIFGGSGGKLYLNLREDKGFTYGAYSGVETSRYVGRFSASTSVRNEVTDSSIVEIIKEIETMIDESVTEEKLSSVKEKFVGGFIMSTEQPSTIANFARNIDKFNLPENFYETYLENFQKVSIDDVKRVSNKYFKRDKLRIIVVGKAAEILSSLEDLPYNIKYFDKRGESITKPDYSTPTGLTPQKVLMDYLNAIGGKENVESLNAVSMLAEAEVQGMKLQMVSIQAKPNKQVTMMMMMGNTMMKMVFDGENGSISQQGVNSQIPEKDALVMSNTTLPIEEIGWLDDENVKFSSTEELDGRILNVLEINKQTYVAYDSETGLKVKETQFVDMPDGSILPQTTFFEDYKPVNGILFPHVIKSPIGPQSLEFKIINISINPEVSDSDFSIDN